MLIYKIFQFMGKNIRTVCNGDEVFFVAGDIAKALNIRGGSFFRTLANLPGNERLTCGELSRQPGNDIVMYQESGRKENLTAKINSQAILLTEAGLYRLVMKSKAEGARNFQNWILHEIIPSLRKNGLYQIQNKNGVMMSAAIELPESTLHQFTQNESAIRRTEHQDQSVNLNFNFKDDEEEFTLKQEMQLNVTVRTHRALMKIETTFFDGASEETIQAIHQAIHQLEEILRQEITNKP